MWNDPDERIEIDNGRQVEKNEEDGKNKLEIIIMM